MKILLSIACCLVIALGAPAQAKKFSTFDDISAHFDAAQEAAVEKLNLERFAALEAFVNDKANASKPDIGMARLEVARMALDLDKYDIAKKHAEAVVKEAKDPADATDAGAIVYRMNLRSEKDANAIKDLCAKLLATLKEDDVNLAVEATTAAANRLNMGLDDFDGAKAVWKLLEDKYGENPKFGMQIKNFVPRQTTEIDTNIASIGTDPTPFSVKDTKGAELSIASRKGKVTLIDFWATWCGPCVADLPNVISAYKKFHSKGFEVIGISLDRDQKAVLDKFLASRPGMKWPQHYDGKYWQNELAVLYGIKSIPATFLLDQNGKIFRTGLRGDALDVAIERLLKDGPPPPRPKAESKPAEPEKN